MGESKELIDMDKHCCPKCGHKWDCENKNCAVKEVVGCGREECINADVTVEEIEGKIYFHDSDIDSKLRFTI